MADKPIFAVCGAGRAGAAMAADMALMGYNVNLFELDRFRDSIDPIMENGGIELSGRTQSGKSGLVKLNKVTMDPREAIEDVDLIMVSAPAFGHQPFFEAFSPYLKEGQSVLVNTGYWACLRLINTLRGNDVMKKITLAEANIMPYLSDKKEHRVHIYNVKQEIKLATFPGKKGDRILELVRHVYPQHRRVPNVLWTNFAAGNPSVHATLMLPMAGIPLDRYMGFKLYGEATVPSARLVEAFDRERLRVAKALGCEAETAFEWVQRTYGYTGKDVAEAFRKSPHADRYIPRERLTAVVSEDLGFFYVPLAQLGDSLGIPTPITKAIVEVMGVMLESNYWEKGVRLEQLGLAGLTADQIVSYVDTGEK